MAELLFGIETEYGLSVTDARRRPMPRGEVVAELLQRAQEICPHLPDGTMRGFFLGNAARLYCDAGDHIEYSTPECDDPSEAVRYTLAGHRFLAGLVAEVDARQPLGRRVRIFRNNVDFAGQVTFGTHESFMHRMAPELLAPQIIPHLVSRLVFTGAGGFNNRSAGLEFMLSPRVAHIECATSSESTHSRGIVHTKNEPLASGGYNRLHLICGESVGSEMAAWLKIGTTALVVALAEAGLAPGDAVTLRHPVLAMRRFATDPTCTKTVAAGGIHQTAVQIQRHYLRVLESNLGQSFLPEWATEVCRRWRGTLDRLETDPLELSATLDWPLKLALYRRHAARRGIPWSSLSAWNRAVTSVFQAWTEQSLPPHLFAANAVLRTGGRVGDEVERQSALLRRAGFGWDGLGDFLALRDELFEIDTRFGELSPEGIFNVLDAAGMLDHHVASVGNVEAAFAEPPNVPRARRRSELVRELSGSDDYRCDWSSVFDYSGRRQDLGAPHDPTATGWREWRPHPAADLLRRTLPRRS